jgi:hypothetical protein
MEQIVTLGLHAYHCSLKLGKSANQPFYALIAAAMRGADDDNLIRLKIAFPGLWEELSARYNAPSGVLPQDGDVDHERLRRTLAEWEKQR